MPLSKRINNLHINNGNCFSSLGYQHLKHSVTKQVLYYRTARYIYYSTAMLSYSERKIKRCSVKVMNSKEQDASLKVPPANNNLAFTWGIQFPQTRLFIMIQPLHT
jgi:hypothetical protein